MPIPLLLDRSRPASRSPTSWSSSCATRSARRASPPGTRLPSSRKLADQLDVSRNTVVRAYEALIDRELCRVASGLGLVRRRPVAVVTVAVRGGARERSPQRASHMPLPARAPRLASAPGLGRGRLTLDFVPRRASAALFPLKTWRRLVQASLSHGGAIGISQYSDPAGLPSLRSAIASHLATARGIAADPSRIVIVRRRAGGHQHRLAPVPRCRHDRRD